jgi:hypothetical protein
MKTATQVAIALVALLITTGCETGGLSKRERPGVTYPNYILSLQPKQSQKPRPQPVLPLRLAVAQVGEPAPAKILLEKLEANHSLVNSVVGLPVSAEEQDRSFNPRDSKQGKADNYSAKMQSICRLAQSVGADYVFIFGGNIDSWQDGNALKVLDFTIVGAAIFPSAKIRAEGRAAGALIETATGDPVLFVSAETKSSTTSPSYQADGRSNTLQARLRDELTSKLADAFLKELADSHRIADGRTTDQSVLTQ